jgi:carboxypeptidase T
MCTPERLPHLASLGIPVDEGVYSKEGYLVSDFYENELDKIIKAGFDVSVLNGDLGKYYQERNTFSQKNMKGPDEMKTLSVNESDWAVPDGFELGSLGGFYTWSEMLLQLDEMAALYPDLITVKAATTSSPTYEGRPIYWVKISDNPEIDEDEPEVLYTGLHHAREPVSMQHMIYYMFYLLENYSTDSLVHYIVDNTELFFIPVVNPDGYVYNEFNNPFGGGNWRKNRRPNGVGSYGVDLNRNYGYMWGADDIGSSPDPWSETFRGDSAFSEAETRNIRDFILGHDFKLVLNYHSYRNGTLFPWGYTDQLTPDDSTFRILASELTHENHYLTGNISMVLSYFANGGSDDWLYGDQVSKPKIFGLTPEIGSNSDGFWPEPEMIIPLCQDNMWQSMAAALLVNKFASVREASPIFMPPHGTVKFNIRRVGMVNDSFTVAIQPLGNEFQTLGPAITYTDLSFMESRTDSIPYTFSTSVQSGQEVHFILSLSYDGISFKDTITKYAGTPYVIYHNPCSTLNDWSGSWDITSENYFSPSYSITDSPWSFYENEVNSSVILNSVIDLSNSSMAFLAFRARWDLEYGCDYVQVLASANNGISWEPLQGVYTHTGNSGQAVGEPIYDGQEKQWVLEAVNLQDYLDSQIKIMFTIVTDLGVTADGFYFDDIEVQCVYPVGLAEGGGNKPYVNRAFPNPAMNNVNIISPHSASSGKIHLKIMDPLGNIVYDVDANNTLISVNASGWNAGLYHYSLLGESGIVASGKFVVLR